MFIISRVGLLAIFLLAWFAPTANASSYTVTEESEWSFTLESADTVYIYGNSNRECNEPGADPYLWLYDDGLESTGALIAANDDGNHGAGQCVSAKIVVQLDAGDYLIRAGYCCNQRGLGYDGPDYELVITDIELIGGTPTTTTVPQTIGAPTNLTLTVDYFNGTVTADWDSPTDGTLDPERYAIGFGLNDEGNAGPYGVATGNVGDENSLNTQYTFDAEYLELLFNEAHGLFNVMIRSDNDTNARYSSWTPVQSTTIMNMPDVVDNQTYVVDSATGDLTFSWDASSDGFVNPSHYQIAWNNIGNMWELEDEGAISSTEDFSQTSYTIAYEDIGSGVEYFNILACGPEGDCHIGETMEIEVLAPTPPTTTTTTTLPPTTTSTTTTTLVPTTTTTEVPPSTTTTSTVPPTTSTSTTTTTSSTTTSTTQPPPSTSTTTLAPVPVTTTAPSTTTTTVATTTTTTTTSIPPTSTTVGTTTTLPVRQTTTTLPQATTTVPSYMAESVDVVEIDEAELKIAETLAEIDEDTAEAFLEVVDGEVTTEEIKTLVEDENFDQLDDDTLSIVAQAVNEAPDEVKAEFQDQVNIFGNPVFDTYVPAGSRVDTGTRRVIVAAAAASVAMSSVGPRKP